MRVKRFLREWARNMVSGDSWLDILGRLFYVVATAGVGLNVPSHVTVDLRLESGAAWLSWPLPWVIILGTFLIYACVAIGAAWANSTFDSLRAERVTVDNGPDQFVNLTVRNPNSRSIQECYGRLTGIKPAQDVSDPLPHEGLLFPWNTHGEGDRLHTTIGARSDVLDLAMLREVHPGRLCLPGQWGLAGAYRLSIELGSDSVTESIPIRTIRVDISYDGVKITASMVPPEKARNPLVAMLRHDG